MSHLTPTLPEVEGAITQIASEILEAGEVKHDDNLLELGVDSLIGTRIVVEIQQRLDVEIPLGTLFENPTVIDFANAILDIIKEMAERRPSP